MGDGWVERISVRRAIACVVGALLLAGLIGCGGARYAVTASGESSVDVAVGEELALSMVERGSGCSGGGEGVVVREWRVTPSRGATVKGRWFVATEPGVYEVTALEPPEYTQFARPAIVRVGGAQAAVKAAEPEPEPKPKPKPAPKPAPAKKEPAKVSTAVADRADPQTIEFVFANVNRDRVANGGVPPTFTLKKARRIRLLESYHLAVSVPAAGTFVLTSGDGTVLGPFKVNRVEDSKGGIENAYWYADVDFVLPAGTYRFIDSDPSTWSQNDGTNGTGFCAVSAVKQ